MVDKEEKKSFLTESSARHNKNTKKSAEYALESSFDEAMKKKRLNRNTSQTRPQRSSQKKIAPGTGAS